MPTACIIQKAQQKTVLVSGFLGKKELSEALGLVKAWRKVCTSLEELPKAAETLWFKYSEGNTQNGSVKDQYLNFLLPLPTELKQQEDFSL